MGAFTTARKKEKFLEALRKRGTVLHSAKAACCDRNTVYKWRRADAEFARAWDSALDYCVEEMEQSLYQRGLAGDNTAAIFWLKGNRPEKYAERYQHVGAMPAAATPEVHLHLDLGKLSDDEIRRAREAIRTLDALEDRTGVDGQAARQGNGATLAGGTGGNGHGG